MGCGPQGAAEYSKGPGGTSWGPRALLLRLPCPQAHTVGNGPPSLAPLKLLIFFLSFKDFYFMLEYRE